MITITKSRDGKQWFIKRGDEILTVNPAGLIGATIEADLEALRQDARLLAKPGEEIQIDKTCFNIVKSAEIEDKVALAIMKNIATQLDTRGHFLTAFAKAVCQADNANLQIIMPVVKTLITKYDLERGQRERGILHQAQYM